MATSDRAVPKQDARNRRAFRAAAEGLPFNEAFGPQPELHCSARRGAGLEQTAHRIIEPLPGLSDPLDRVYAGDAMSSRTATRKLFHPCSAVIVDDVVAELSSPPSVSQLGKTCLITTLAAIPLFRATEKAGEGGGAGSHGRQGEVGIGG